MRKTTVSVAVCAYNSSRYGEEQLESIASQSRLPDEVVICDDDSVDDTPSILERFRKKAPFDVRIHRNETNLGVTRNFEKAIALCSSDIIALSDCDDIWRGDKLERVCAVLEDHPGAGYAFSDGELIGPDGTPLGVRMWDRQFFQQLLLSGFPPKSQVPALLQFPVVTGAAMAIRSSIRPFVLPVAQCWLHDYWISLLAAFIGLYGVAIPEPLLKYRVHLNQTIGLRRSFVERCKASFVSRVEPWPEHITAFQGLRGRLHNDSSITNRCHPHELDLLEQKLAHLCERARARSAAPLKKYRIILAEAFTGRYQRFSLSWQSIVRDLCP
jgi:glycosyltransferase involved in cell wall biosynthesis